MMPARCVVALGRGIDGALAAALMRDQGVDVVALHMTTPFSHGVDGALRWSKLLGVPLEVVSAGDSYAQVVRHPRFRRGRHAAPCIDCRIHLFTLAREAMERLDCDFVVSGEVLGQRRVGQRRIDFETIARHSGLEDRLLRPLSALALRETAPERSGLVDRSRLLGITGADRAPLRGLATARGWTDLPAPTECCSLTNATVAARVYDLLASPSRDDAWELPTLAFGRHYRLSGDVKVVLGRNAAENARLEEFFHASTHVPRYLGRPLGFEGPTALLIGAWDQASLAVAAALVVRHSAQSATSRSIAILNAVGAEDVVMPGPEAIECAAALIAIGIAQER